MNISWWIRTSVKIVGVLWSSLQPAILHRREDEGRIGLYRCQFSYSRRLNKCVNQTYLLERGYQYHWSLLPTSCLDFHMHVSLLATLSFPGVRSEFPLQIMEWGPSAKWKTEIKNNISRISDYEKYMHIMRQICIALKSPVWGCPICILWGGGPGRIWAQSGQL